MPSENVAGPLGTRAGILPGVTAYCLARRARLVFVACIAALACGCSVVNAARLPPRLDFDQPVAPGTARGFVVERFGSPAYWRTDAAGRRVEIYRTVPGYTRGEKALRVSGNLVMDALFFPVWEMVVNPPNPELEQEPVLVGVVYDEHGTAVESAIVVDE